MFDYFSKPPVILVNEYDKCCEALEEFEIGLEIASARMIAGTMESEETSIYFASLTQGTCLKVRWYLRLCRCYPT